VSNLWPKVRLGEVVQTVERRLTPQPGTAYRQIGVKLWGEGAYERKSLDGSATKYASLFRTEVDDIIVNKIWARNGSVAVVPGQLAGCLGSSEFPMFAPDRDRLEPRWMHWLTKTPSFWAQCDQKSRGTSGKNRIRPERFLEIEIPLPPLAEQRRVVARMEELAAQIREVHTLRQQEELELKQMLFGAFTNITASAPRRSMREVAPLVRRSVQVHALGSYRELGIRSFGKGAFHKPALSGLEVGDKRIFQIEPGDLLFSNVFAWEGAIAVAKPEDAGRVGSHRFITCVPEPSLATAPLLCFYFLTDEGLRLIRAASPGGAGRNRTLGLMALEAIEVPVPPVEDQRWFNTLLAEVDALKRLQAETAAELDALLPAILDRAFRGEL
jgi:type I restriction enzyme S subunit